VAERRRDNERIDKMISTTRTTVRKIEAQGGRGKRRREEEGGGKARKRRKSEAQARKGRRGIR